MLGTRRTAQIAYSFTCCLVTRILSAFRTSMTVGMSSNARLRAAVGGTPPVQGLVGQTVWLSEKIRKSLNRLYKDLYFHPERVGLSSLSTILRKVLVLSRVFDSISLSVDHPSFGSF